MKAGLEGACNRCLTRIGNPGLEMGGNTAQFRHQPGGGPAGFNDGGWVDNAVERPRESNKTNSKLVRESREPGWNV